MSFLCIRFLLKKNIRFLESINCKLMENMSDRSSNGDYKYRDEDENKSRLPLEKEQDSKDHQIDKASEFVRELIHEKIEIHQKWPNAARLLDQGA